MDTTTIAKTEKGIKGRCERGIALYAAGAVFRHGDLYVVRGTRRAYTVCLEHPTMGETCDCPDHREKQTDPQCPRLMAVTTLSGETSP